MFGANIYHAPGLCLLGIGGSYISLKIMAQEPYFHISPLKQPTGGVLCYARRLPQSRPS